MRGSTMGLVAAAALVAGVAGCSLPEVLPMAGGTTQGPSPYGPWYEQHWATNSVLLAAADQPQDELIPEDEDQIPSDNEPAAPEGADSSQLEGTPVQPEAAVAPPNPNPSVEASADSGSASSADFDNSTPYQFPSSSYSPAPAVVEQPAAQPAPPPAADPNSKTVPAGPGGTIRY